MNEVHVTGAVPEVNPHEEQTATHEIEPTHEHIESAHTEEQTPPAEPEPEPIKIPTTTVVHDGFCIICGDDLQAKNNVRPGVMFKAMTHVVRYAGRQGVRICKTCLDNGSKALSEGSQTPPAHT